MFIQINASENTATIQESEVLTSFEIRSQETDPKRIASIINNQSSVADDNHVWVSIAWVLQQVEHKHDADWKQQFENMIRYADSKGWLNEKQTHLQAHIEIEP
mgnify:FL=1|tara:strand:- start:1323 stop:1631 length:309 start_codon:yes stop_codon:yes gene_type:complete